jgi:hypothetical protein
VLCVPFTGSVPPQAPEAAHEVALVEDHVKVDPLPLVTLVGLALIDTVGEAVVVDEAVVVGEAVLTVAVADWAVLPPVPVAACAPAPVILTPEPHADKPAARTNTSGKCRLRIRNRIGEFPRDSINTVFIGSMKFVVRCGCSRLLTGQ